MTNRINNLKFLHLAVALPSLNRDHHIIDLVAHGVETSVEEVEEVEVALAEWPAIS